MGRRVLRVVKPEVRVVGIDDGRFTPHSKEQVHVVGVVFRGGYWLDGLMCTLLTVDDFDATEKIANMILQSPHYKQLRVIMLNGITFAGFNIVDLKALNTATKLPVIAVTHKKPDLVKVQRALGRLPKSQERWKAIQNAGEILTMSTRNPNQKIYVEIAGINEQISREVLRLTSTRSNIPEALRVAHIVASGISSCRKPDS